MKFTVSYRSKDGKIDQMQVEASDRSAVFAELSKRGISAIRVEETSSKAKKAKSASSVPSARKPSPFRGVFAGLIVIALAVAAWYYLLPTIEQVKSKRDKKTSLIADVAHSQSGQDVDPVASRQEVSGNSAKNKGVGNSAGAVAEESQPADSVIEDVRPRRREPALKLETDQLISMATSIPPDVMVPPLPVMSEGDTDKFIEALNTPLEIGDDDSEDVRRLKESVQNIRFEIAQMMQENPDLTLSEILNEHRNIANHNTKCRADVIAEIHELTEEGDFDAACRVRDTMNLAFQQIGIPEIDMPITPEERAAAGEDPDADSAD